MQMYDVRVYVIHPPPLTGDYWSILCYHPLFGVWTIVCQQSVFIVYCRPTESCRGDKQPHQIIRDVISSIATG